MLTLNSASDDHRLDLSKMKAFAYHKFKITQLTNFFSDRVENIPGKGEHPCYQHSLSHNVSLTLYSINTHFDASTTDSF